MMSLPFDAVRLGRYDSAHADLQSHQYAVGQRRLRSGVFGETGVLFQMPQPAHTLGLGRGSTLFHRLCTTSTERRAIRQP